jgi:hypothetical protein
MVDRGEFESVQDQLKVGVGYELRRAFANYPETVAAAKKAVELWQKIDEIIEFVNSGELPEGYMIATLGSSEVPEWAVKSSYIRGLREFPKHGNFIYRPNEAGEYVLAGEIATGSSTQVFLGDRFLKIDGQLVIVNSEHQVGMTPSKEVDIVDMVNDPFQGTSGGTHQERFDFFLGVIDEVRDGAQVHADLSWG